MSFANNKTEKSLCVFLLLADHCFRSFQKGILMYVYLAIDFSFQQLDQIRRIIVNRKGVKNLSLFAIKYFNNGIDVG